MRFPKYGHAEPRIFTPPLRELTPETSLGFACIEFVREVLHEEPLPWQEWLLIHALELKKPIGTHLGPPQLRFRTILTLVGRQNGKSHVTRWIILYFMFIRQVSLVIGLAQSLGIAESLWEQAVDMIYSSPALAEDVIKVHRANGGKRVIVDCGDGRKAEYKVESASRRGGRGLSGDLIVLDELREQTTFECWAAVTKVILTRASGLIFCITNAGDSSSVVLEYLRDMAHRLLGDPDNRFDDDDIHLSTDDDTAVSASLGFFEWSAPPGADPADPETWAWANPSAGYLIEWETLRDSQLTDPADVFLTECLCQWVENLGEKPFPEGAWEASLDPMSEIDEGSPLTFGVDVAPDRKHCAIAVCGQRADGDYHIELVAYMSRMSMVGQWFRRRVDSYGGAMTVCVQGRGCPASALISSLNAIPGVNVVPCQGPALTAACGAFHDSISACVDELASSDELRVFHLAQPGLDLAAEVAQKKLLGDAWVWNRKASREDVAPLCAATWAFGYASGVYDDAPLDAEKPKHPSALHQEGRKRALLFV